MNTSLFPNQNPNSGSVQNMIEFTEQVERIVYAKFITANNTVNKTFEASDTFQLYDLVGNTDGGFEQLLNDASPLCSAPLEPTDLRNQMLLINDIWNEIENRAVILKDIRFSTIFNKSKGGAGKTADEVNTLLLSSLDDINWGFPQSQFRRSPLVTFAPNWFNPVVRANNYNVIAGNERTNADHEINNKTLYAFGLELPFYAELNRKVDSITDLKVYSSLYNAIDFGTNGGVKYQRYPLYADMTIYVLK